MFRQEGHFNSKNPTVRWNRVDFGVTFMACLFVWTEMGVDENECTSVIHRMVACSFLSDKTVCV